MFDNRFNPNKWNIYLFYFTDGENWDGDNQQFIKILNQDFSSKTVNMIGITQILAWNYEGSLKQFVDNAPRSFSLDLTNVQTTQISYPPHSSSSAMQLSEEDRNTQIKNSIIELLGKGNERK